MKATITVEYRPMKPHEKTGGPDRPWVGETLVQPIQAHDRTGTCRGATFVDALNMCVAGLVEHYQEQEACEKDLDLDDAETGAIIERLSPTALACMIPTDKIPAAMAAIGAELPTDDPEDSDPELPEDYDPSEDLSTLRAPFAPEAFVRLQLYILKLQGEAPAAP